MATEVKIRPYRERTGDGGLRLNFHAGQVRAWRSSARFPVILAGLQSGKTCLLADWLKREIDDKGAGDYFAATASFPLLSKKLLPEFQEVFCNIWRLGEYKEGAKEIRFHDGKTRIFFLSADSPEAAESMTAKGGVLDEAGQKQFRRDTWIASQGRVSLSQGRILIATSLYGFGWLKNDVYDRWVAGDKDFDLIQFDSIANPAFPRAEYDRMKRILPPWLFDLRYRGRFTRPAGLVYDSFNETTNKIKRFQIPKEWPRYTGHDFGTANPAITFWAQDIGTGDFFIYDTYKPGQGQSTAQIVAELNKRTKGLTVLRRVGGSHQEEGWRGEYAAHGWPITEPKIARVDEQIGRIYSLFKLNKIHIFDDMYDLLDEVTSFSYKLDDKYNATNEYEDETRYHLLATVRYLGSDFTPETVRRQPQGSLRYGYA